jgi:putative SOS response-associated peptidase YedK
LILAAKKAITTVAAKSSNNNIKRFLRTHFARRCHITFENFYRAKSGNSKDNWFISENKNWLYLLIY